MKKEFTKNEVSRRRFIGTSAMAAAALTMLSGSKLTASGSPPVDVALAALGPKADDDIIEAAVWKAAFSVTDFSWLGKGETVIIKPASNSGNPYPAVTSPAGVRAMVKLLKKKGAGRVIVTEQSGIEHIRRNEKELKGSSRKLMENNNLDQAARDVGAEVIYPEEGPYEDYFPERTGPGSHWKQGVRLPNVLKEADHVVLLPRVGSHVLAGASLGFKAAVGWLRHDSRLELHRDADTCFEKIAEIHSAPIFRKKLKLTLSVANRVLATFGPDKGYVATPDPGLVIASTNLLAHDMAAMAWYLWTYENITPKTAKMKDPRRFSTSRMNKYVVKMGWGKEEASKTADLAKFNLDRAATDPTIAYAAKLWGGLPQIKWTAEKTLKPKLINEISAYLT